MKVENKDAHRAANSHYFFATHVRDGDGSGDDVVMLLLTEKALERAAKRAEKYPEDLPEHFAIVQGKTAKRKHAVKTLPPYLMILMSQSQRSRAAF